MTNLSAVPPVCGNYRAEATEDPTPNVLRELAATSERLDSLRNADYRCNQLEIGHLKEMANLRAKHSDESGEKESKRIDAILAADAIARNTAAANSAEGIVALAATTASNAENLRTALGNTAAAIAKQTAEQQIATAKLLADSLAELAGRISSLEKSSYKGEGKQGVEDPMMHMLIAEVKNLSLSRQNDHGKVAGISMGGTVLIAVATLVLAVAGSSMFAKNNESPQPITIKIDPSTFNNPTTPSVLVKP